jgi:putative membrane protein
MKDFRRGFAILVTAVILLVVIGIAWEVMFAGRDQFPCTPNTGVTSMMPWMFWGGGMWVFPLIGLIVFLVVVYFVMTRLIAGGGPGSCWSGPERRGSGGESPMEILKIRYAKGDISREEFERMKKDVTENGGTGR